MLSQVTAMGVWAGPSGGAAPAAALPEGYAYGCVVTRTGNGTVQISAGRVRSDDNTEDIVVPAPVNADISTTGAGGRNVDTAEQANKWYLVCLIKNVSTGTVSAFLINEDDIGGFTWPAGYSVKRRMGYIRNGSTSDFRHGRYTGIGNFRKWHYDHDAGYLLALNAGSATVYTDVDLSEWVPPTSQTVLLNVVLDPFSGSITYLRPNGCGFSQQATYIYRVTNQSNLFLEMSTDDSQIIEYKCFSANDDLSLYVQGFFDEV